MNEPVELHSGAVYAQKPLALIWEGKRLVVTEILSEGRTPNTKWFRVRTEDGELFELTYSEVPDLEKNASQWQIRPI